MITDDNRPFIVRAAAAHDVVTEMTEKAMTEYLDAVETLADHAAAVALYANTPAGIKDRARQLADSLRSELQALQAVRVRAAS